MLNFAIIGCGAIGARHAGHAAAFGRLLAVCDIIEEKACSLGKQYGARFYKDVEEMLESEQDLDVVAVCTPNGLHPTHSINALKAGRHVICEKPMALRSEDCRHMIEQAASSGRHLFVVKQNRFNPPVAYMKQMLDKGSYGRICSIQMNGSWSRGADYYEHDWHGSRDMDGGILYTQFSHFIDLLCWLFGDVKEVYAMKDNFLHKAVIGFEDTVTATVRLSAGALGSLHFTINSYESNMEGSLLVVAEKATIKIGGQYLNTLEYLRCEVKEKPALSVGNHANDYGAYQGSMSNHDKIYEHVVSVIEQGAPNLFDGQSGLKTVEVIEKIYKSAI
jgi:predicted dehydrogenase